MKELIVFLAIAAVIAIVVLAAVLGKKKATADIAAGKAEMKAAAQRVDGDVIKAVDTVKSDAGSVAKQL